MNRTRHKVKLKGSEKSPLGSNKSSAVETSSTLWGGGGEGWVCHFGLNTDLVCKTQGERLFVSIMEEFLTVSFWMTQGCANNFLHADDIRHCHSDLCNKRQPGIKKKHV